MIELLPPPLRRAVSPYTGIVRSVEECLCSTSEPRFFQAACDVGQSESVLGLSLGHLTGLGGAGRTRAGAATAAVGEALERYSATYVPLERLVVATARELGEEAVAPERFALFSDAQHREAGFPYRPFTADTRIAWVEGRALPDGRPVLLPAELVFLGPVPHEQPIGYTTSSGLACAELIDESIVRAVCELLERDAFMLVWANRLSLPLLGTDGTRSGRDEVEFERTGLAFAAVDMSAIHNIPIALGVVRAPAGYPGATGVGAAAAPTIEQAWWKAVAEAFASRSAGVKLGLLRFDPSPSGRDRRVVSFEDHILRYADHQHAHATTFLDASRATTSFDSVPPLEGETPAVQIAGLCRRIEAAGSSAYAVDVTSPDVAELGLVVTRAIAPELCALNVSESARFLGGRRLYEAAARLGLRDDILLEACVNPDPHPFP